MAETPYDTLVRQLRALASMNDARRRAGVELLIRHSIWLRRLDFYTAAVEQLGQVWVVNWQKAREFLDSDPVGSTSELAILDLAVTLAQDRFRFSIMGPATSGLVLDAIRDALE